MMLKHTFILFSVIGSFICAQAQNGLDRVLHDSLDLTASEKIFTLDSCSSANGEKTPCQLRASWEDAQPIISSNCSDCLLQKANSNDLPTSLTNTSLILKVTGFFELAYSQFSSFSTFYEFYEDSLLIHVYKDVESNRNKRDLIIFQELSSSYAPKVIWCKPGCTECVACKNLKDFLK